MFLSMLLAPIVHASLIIFTIAFGILDVTTVPPTISLGREFYGEDGAIVFGWVNAAHQGGAGLMALLGGFVRDYSGSYNLVWIASGGLCAVAAAVALAIRRTTASSCASV